MSGCVVASANRIVPTMLINVPMTMNGLRTRTLSDSTPAMTSAIALVIQYQLASELAFCSE